MKQIKVNAIKDGTVIDHIAAGKVLKVIGILNLPESDVVMIGMNLASNKIGRKDILKIENKELSQEEVNRIALISPHATMIIIKDYEVVQKHSLELPDYIEKLIICPNPKCVTNIEMIDSKFQIIDEKPAAVRCVYCEKKYGIDEVKVKI